MSLIRAKLVGDVVSGSTFAGIVTATGFDGDLVGNVTGDVNGNVSGNANVGILTATTVSIGDSTGKAGQYLQSTGIGVTWADIDIPEGGLSVFDSNVIGFNAAGIRSDSANGRLEVFGTGNFRVYESPGTFTVNPGISSIRVRVIGAGGNGGVGVAPRRSAPPSFPGIIIPGSGSGGGGGGYAHKVITSFPAPRTYSVTVGTPGGGTSSFGSEVSATGGTNAGGQTSGVGGNGINGDVNYSGFPGIPALSTIPQGSPFSPPLPNPVAGTGGASGTQLGNATGVSVPGIPNIPFPGKGYSVRRFPFDTFEGYNGVPVLSIGFDDGVIIQSSATPRPGFEGGYGGSSGDGIITFPGRPGGTGAGGGKGGTPASVGSGGLPGGAGGIGGGGGGGGQGTSVLGLPLGGAGGAGGPGLVIVEW